MDLPQPVGLHPPHLHFPGSDLHTAEHVILRNMIRLKFDDDCLGNRSNLNALNTTECCWFKKCTNSTCSGKLLWKSLAAVWRLIIGWAWFCYNAAQFIIHRCSNISNLDAPHRLHHFTIGCDHWLAIQFFLYFIRAKTKLVRILRPSWASITAWGVDCGAIYLSVFTLALQLYISVSKNAQACTNKYSMQEMSHQFCLIA
jgi:hypothetical protein